jgi:hypothetical protein
VLARPESPHIDFEWNFKSDKLLGQWFQKSFRPEGAAELAFAIKFKKGSSAESVGGLRLGEVA